MNTKSGYVCTCGSEGGCAAHGIGPAGVYRKSFEHASDNYNAEKTRANDAERAADIQKEKYNKLSHHIYAAFPQHKDEGPWGAVSCARRQIEDTEARSKSAEQDIERLIKEKSVLEQRVIELRAAYRAAAWEMLESEMKMRQRGML